MSALGHPSLVFFALGALLLVVRGRAARALLAALPVLALACVLGLDKGQGPYAHWMGQTLVFARVDALSLVFATVFAAQAALGFLFALHLPGRGQHAAAACYVAGAFGCVFAGDWLTLFFFWEVMSVASTLVVWLGGMPGSARAGFRYFLVHALGGVLLLAGTLLHVKAAGGAAFTALDPARAGLAEYLMLAGVLVNAAAVPLHAWLPDAYPKASATGAVFLSAFTTKTAVYVLIRAFAGFEILVAVGCLMALWGVVFALAENSIRRILSYEIVSQVGYMVTAVGVGTAMTLDGAAAHAFAHILYKGLLFMAAGALLTALGTDKLTRLGGLGARMPLVFALFLVGVVSVSGAPLFSGFVTKTMIIAGAGQAHHTLASVLLELTSVGTFLAAGLRIGWYAFVRPAPAGLPAPSPLPANMTAAMVLAALGCLGVGLFPGALYALLPVQPVPFVPYTAWNVVLALTLMGFAWLGFRLFGRAFAPRPGQVEEFDGVYRAVGRAVLALARRPVESSDAWWSERFRLWGLDGLMRAAKACATFDWEGVKAAVDGLAAGVAATGGRVARAHKGFLGESVAFMVVAGVGVFGLGWFVWTVLG